MLPESVRADTNGYTIKTGERERRSDTWNWVEDGYRVVARRRRSELFTESVEPSRAD